MKRKNVCYYPVFWAMSLAALVSVLTLLERNFNVLGIGTSAWLNLPMVVVGSCALILAAVDYQKLKAHKGTRKSRTA